MELRQLRCFVTVVEEANFTRAAARLHLAQPGVSARVRQLEKELGQQLLDRSGRTVTPTEAGEAILAHARAALAAVDAMRETADEFGGLLRGRVRLGSLLGAPPEAFDLAGVLADFHDAYPGVEFSLTEDTSDRLLMAVRRGALDMALASIADERPPPGVDLQVLLDEPLMGLVADGDPLGGAAGDALRDAYGDALRDADPVPLAALRDRPLITLPSGTGVRAVLERACAEAGFEPLVAFEASAPQALLQLAARGFGVAVLPAGIARRSGPGLRKLALTDPAPRARVALARPANGPAGPAARTFLDHLVAALRTRLADAGAPLTGAPLTAAPLTVVPLSRTRPSG
ncbi:LysR family transcriptional regulator [Streptomyces spiroverticillatus]|uniref:LysR family transcriptional regulator n=1 Tax=Streptomyces finlayi TaxID=67296 RepID=A0A919CE49_9ACTN|nr:LysR substrate-binding domain-containing protein [Streptomyces finlayi]GHA39273.1 LysR family transcriptional regulator [Streptomyces spiroverticillatus]GHD14161.1 LysR family transcriptional regulator [Streptomyces finlayi]